MFKGDLHQVSDAVNGLTATASQIVLGGDLIQDTTIDATTAYELFLAKDNVTMELVNSALPGGAGEAARFYGSDGTSVAEVGVYTSGGGVPSAGLRSSSATQYWRMRQLPSIDRLIMDAGITANTYGFHTLLGSTISQFGFQDGGALIGFEVEKLNF